jgi:hypothetical protein
LEIIPDGEARTALAEDYAAVLVDTVMVGDATSVLLDTRLLLWQNGQKSAGSYPYWFGCRRNCVGLRFVCARFFQIFF